MTTIILTECVLVYLEPQSVPQLKAEIAGFFSDVAFIDYEMFNASDAFGKVMVRNFEVSSPGTRGAPPRHFRVPVA